MHLQGDSSIMHSRQHTNQSEASRAREQKLKDMIAALPVMSRKEVRRYRVEYHRAICCDLQEEGFTSASRLINNLVEIDEVRRKRAGPNSLITLKPKLKTQNKMLDCLKIGLKQAEKEERRGQHGNACTAYLNLALYFKEKGEDWFWVANILFYGSYHRGARYLTDGSRKEAIARFAFGKFLLEDVKKLRSAHKMLETARTLSMGKLWTLPALKAPTVSPALFESLQGYGTEEEKEDREGKLWSTELEASPENQVSIYQETCVLIHKSLLQMAAEVKEKRPLSDKEVKLCMQALRRATESENIEVQLEALKALGMCYMERNDLKTAVNYFEGLLCLSTQSKIWAGICDAHLSLGQVYSRMKSTKEALHHFNEQCTAAKNSGSNSLLGKAYRSIGIFHLLNDDPENAAPLLKESFHEFYEQNQIVRKELEPVLTSIGEIKRKMMTSKSQDTAVGQKLHDEYQRLKDKGKKLWSTDTHISMDETRILAAIAKGLKNMPQYAQLVLQSDHDRKAMAALMKWRGNGVPFWESRTSIKPQDVPFDEVSVLSPESTMSNITFPELSSSEDLSYYSSSDEENEFSRYPSAVLPKFDTKNQDFIK
ncbi:uncharacterized protein LOC124162747 [Ischnura elegans]|uniref:uncharacterized protein LOC124162747 n=1 Tax=Ischnura elegans TaxID=197161 RepID=UPI001ED88A7B|nr:uncharacterized protein LOC124162747 [Ischnura elegans]